MHGDEPLQREEVVATAEESGAAALGQIAGSGRPGSGGARHPATVLCRSSCCSSARRSGPGSMPSSSISRLRTREYAASASRLSASAVEGRHERGPQSLPERVLGHQGLELSDQLPTGTEVDTCGHHVLEETQPDLVERARWGAAQSPPSMMISPRNSRSPSLAFSKAVAHVTSVPGRGRLGGEVEHLDRVHAARFDGESVGVALADDGVPVAEGAPQLGDLRLQGVAAHAGWPTGPRAGHPRARWSRLPGRAGRAARWSCLPAPRAVHHPCEPRPRRERRQ